MTHDTDIQPGAELVTDSAYVTDSPDTAEQAAVGRITLSAARRFGLRASALAGLAASAGMMGAMAVADHTTPSVTFF